MSSSGNERDETERFRDVIVHGRKRNVVTEHLEHHSMLIAGVI